MLTTGYAWVVVGPLNSKKGVAVDEDQLTAARKHPRSRAESPLRGCSDDRSCGDQAPRRIDQISPPSVTTYAVLPMNSSEVGWFRCQATGVNPPSPSTMRSRPVLVSAGAGPALIDIGLGLLFSQRWAWALALLAGAGGIVLGVLAATSPGDIAAPGAQLIAVVLFLLPGLVLLGTLLQPRTLRWLRQPRARDESRVRYFE
jgi:hypothetical protein